VFFLPAEGAVSEMLQNRGIPYAVIKEGRYNNQTKTLRDVFVFGLCLLPGLLRLFRAIRKYRVKLIYSNAVRNCVLTALAGSLFGIPVVWHIHHYFSDKKAINLLTSLGRLSCIRQIVFVSNFVRSQFPLFTEKSVVIYNGVDINKIRERSDRSSLDITGNIGVMGEKRIVSVIANIQRAKAQETLIMSIPIILNEYPECHFVFVGRVFEKSYYEALQKIANKIGINECVSFPGYCDDVPGLLKGIYLNIITSVESFSLILLECMSLGVPTLVPDVGGPLEVIGKSVPEVTYEFSNERDLAGKVVRLLKDDYLYSSIRNYFRERANDLNINIFNERIGEVVDQVMCGRVRN